MLCPQWFPSESFTYDDQGRQHLHVSFEGVVTENIYDSVGRMSEMRYYQTETDFNTGTVSETRQFAFDEYGRNVGNVLKDGAGNIKRVEETVYDSRGRILFEKSPEGILGYGYDNAGRMAYTAVFESSTAVSAVNPPPLTTADRVTHYGYDILGRLVSVQEDITPTNTSDATQDTAYTFDLQGRADTTELPNGVTSDYDYDALGRLDTQTDTDTAGNILAAYDYEVRADGKRTALEETFWFDANDDGIQTANELKTTTYNWTYDDVGRLTDEVLDHWDNSIDRAEHFEYDLTGNRKSLSTDLNLDGIIDDLVTYHYDANDRLITELLDTGNNGTTDQTTAYTYDQTQQRSKSVVAAGLTTTRQTFTYNLQGRMNAVINDGFDASGNVNARERTSYTYDSRSFRINLTNATTTDFVSDPTDVKTWTLASSISFLAAHNNHTGYTQTIRETTTNADGTTKTIDYTFGHDEISQRVVERNAVGDITSDTTHIFGHDGHGSVRMLTDLAGTIAQVYTFSSYGVMLAVHNSVGTSVSLDSRLSSLGYSGEHFDAKALQQYLRARFYNPANGRFNRLDPFAGNNTDPQSFHKYLYTHADPVNGVDPTGLFTLGSVSFSTGINITVGSAVVGALTYRFALGRSLSEGFLVGVQFGVGFSIAPNKGEALFMGVASGLFEALIQQFFEKKEPLDVAAEAIKAFSDGVLDSAWDQIAVGAKVFPNGGTHNNDAAASLGQFIVGGAHPFFVFVRSLLFAKVNGQAGPATTAQIMSATLEAIITYATNKSGLDLLSKVNLPFKLPTSVRKFISKQGAGALADAIQKAGGAEAVAEKVTKFVSQNLERTFKQVGGFFGRWAEDMGAFFEDEEGQK